MAEASIRSALGVHSGVSTAGTMPRASRLHAYLAAVECRVDRAATLLAEADARDMSGWDFAWLDGRMTSSGLPWDYPAIVDEWVSRSSSVLDMGTGGGEFLSVVRGLPARTVATEGWAPNVQVAAQRLSAIHVPVVHDEGAIDNLDQRRARPSRTARVPRRELRPRAQPPRGVQPDRGAASAPPRRLVPDATSRLGRR